MSTPLVPSEPKFTLHRFVPSASSRHTTAAAGVITPRVVGRDASTSAPSGSSAGAGESMSLSYSTTHEVFACLSRWTTQLKHERLLHCALGPPAS